MSQSLITVQCPVDSASDAQYVGLTAVLLVNGVPTPYAIRAVDDGAGRAILQVQQVDGSGNPVSTGGSSSTATTTTTYPASPPNNAAGTAGNPLYSDSAGRLLVNDPVLNALISGGKLAVSDVITETSLGQLTALIASGALTVKDPNLAAIIANNALAVSNLSVAATTSTRTSVASTTSATQILAANTNRKGAVFLNDGSTNLFLALGSTGSTTDYTLKLGPGVAYEMTSPRYTGSVFGVWDSVSGNCRITELS